MAKLPFFEKAHRGNINFYKSRKDFGKIFFLSYLLAIFIFFICLGIRLFHLTIVKGNYYRRLAEENRVKELIIEPKRGKILDRKGLIVAYNSDPDLKSHEDRITSGRNYDNPEAIAPLIGFRQIADKNDLKNDNCLNKLKSGDKVGKAGVEKLFECDLRGRSGKKLVEVDAHGKYLKTLSVVPPQDGQTIQLGLDEQLQKKAYELIKDKKAAVVSLKPSTGEILILASSPSFSPQAFETENSKEINKYFKDDTHPLFNRATRGTYPPGSTFKPFLAAAALEEKRITDETLFNDTGVIQAGPRTFGNWYFLEYGKTEGELNVISALKRSNDIFFYKTAEAMGVSAIKNWSYKFGLAQKTKFGLDEEEGLMPSTFWKEETLKEKWYLGDTYNLAIGQGYLLVTPLQLARATASLANNANICQPLLLKVETGHAPSLQNNVLPVCQKLPLSPKTLNVVIEGMKQACSAGGTGWPFFDFKPPVACKTGTAESHGEEKNPHAWFTVFAPIEKPEIVVTVLVEESGQGSDIAAPIAKEILKTYFERKE